MASSMTRRMFIQVVGTIGAGLSLGGCALGQAGKDKPTEEPKGFSPNVWITLMPGGDVVIRLARTEMGQGVTTSLPMMVAEELEVDFARVRVEPAPLDPAFGETRTTAAMSVYLAWDVLRKVGAAARHMMIGAAALGWGVPAEQCRAEKGVVFGPGGQRRPYTELFEAAARIPAPQDPPLKTSGFRVLGHNFPRLDAPDKVTGKAAFGIDTRLPGMAYAVLERSPVVGGKVRSFKADAALAIKGVSQVFEIDRGVAVVADNSWTASKGREALEIDWDEGPNASLSSQEISTRLLRALDGPGAPVLERGDAAGMLAKAAKRITATYEVPFLAHATMEPMNCTAHVEADRCTLWAPTQNPGRCRQAAARVLGMPEEAVTVHRTLVGGGFGRRGEDDYVVEAVQISRKVGKPVKLLWSRKDDLQNDRFRPPYVQRLTAGVDATGKWVAFKHELAGPSVLKYYIPARANVPFDRISIAGAADFPYAVPHVRVDSRHPDVGVPVGILRGIGEGYTCFAKESFLDEVAAALKMDPVKLRLELLRDSPRARRVLEVAVDKAGWGTPLPPGVARGVALATEEDTAGNKGFSVFLAQVAEVRIVDGEIRVQRVVCAADCGRIIHPDGAAAQVEGATLFGLSSLVTQITLANGRVEQQTFADYPVLRMADSPRIEVHLVDTDHHPAGLGEKAVSPIAAAVGNAVFALTGQRLRRLPFKLA